MKKTRAILKYTSNQLIDELIKNEKVNMQNKKDEAKRISDKYGIEDSTLEELLNRPNVLSYEMYQSLSIILGKSIDELTKIEVEDLKCEFRGVKIGEESEEIDSVLILANNLFDEIILAKKLGGENE